MNRMKTLILTCGIGVSLLAAVGCSKKDPAEIVRQRAVERWELLAGKHSVKAYDYLSPGYRSTHTLEQYVAFVTTSRVQWKSAKVDAVQCEEDVCTAKLTVVSMLPGTVLQRPSDMEYPAAVVEKWILSEGQWYFLPKSKVDAKGIAEQAEAKPAAQAPQSVPPAQTPPAGDQDKN
ncbi:MAG: hypothetical protein QM741_03385 [Rudaea sp.]|uniref:hypothetical protein n=1 Tax=Rudaea sp. TaxID=2136325 RepID=UPI0039E71105